MGEISVITPWGVENARDPLLPARLWTWPHYRLRHRYTVTAGRIECECGESFEGRTGAG